MKRPVNVLNKALPGAAVVLRDGRVTHWRNLFMSSSSRGLMRTVASTTIVEPTEISLESVKTRSAGAVQRRNTPSMVGVQWR